MDSFEPLETNYKGCIGCKKLCIPNYSSFKNCSSCREKNRNKKNRSVERKVARQKLIARSMADINHVSFPYDDEESDDTIRMADGDSDPSSAKENGMRVTETGAVKRKAPKALHDLEGEEQMAALKEMKKCLNAKIKASGVNGTIVVDLSGRAADSGKQYQTASALYEGIKSKALHSSAHEKSLRFRGCHSIVAVSTINNKKRMQLVVNDLRKIAKISFENSTSSVDCSKVSGAYNYKFRCTCAKPSSAHAPMPSPPVLSAQTTIKGTQGDLIRWARARAAADTTTAPRPCGGEIAVTVVSDDSHPCGIPGQQIIIRIEHPK